MSRQIVLVACLFMALPLAGCVGNSAPATVAGLVFTFEPIERGDPSPVRVESCQSLLEALNQRAIDEARVHLEQNVQRWNRTNLEAWGMSGSQASADGASAPSSGGFSAATAEVTGTNNQEAAADEGDIVKTDGEWTYVLSGGLLHILQSENVGEIAPYGQLDLGQAWGGQLLLENNDPDNPLDDRLVVALPGQRVPSENDTEAEHALYYGGATRIIVLSLADRRSPQVMSDMLIEGEARAARLVDGTAYVVVHAYAEDLGLQTHLDVSDSDPRRGSVGQLAYLKTLAREADAANQQRLEGLTLDDHLPRIYQTQDGTQYRQPTDDFDCSGFYTTPGSTGRGVTTIVAMDMASAEIPSATTQVAGGSPIVYASGEALVLAAPTQDPWWFWAQPALEDATDLQWFDLDGLDVRPRASGRVLGTVLDSFSLDVEGDRLRVVTTTGTWARWWDEQPEPMVSHVAVFEEVQGALVPKGVAGGIAPGERVWSARFTEDRAYVVTFEQIDPLWIIDLAAPTPTILGELEIPGVSTYIHPLDDDALLTIGHGPGPEGQGLDWGRVQVSLFDISDPSEPQRADVLDLGPGGNRSWSGAIHEHKAFTYWPAVGKLALPLTTEGDGSNGSRYQPQTGLRLIHVDRDALDLRTHGAIDQDALHEANASWAPPIQRSYFLGYPQEGPVSVYAVSALGVTAHDLTTLAAQDSVGFPERRDHWYYG